MTKPERQKRTRRDRADIRDLLLEAAINEFASKGFEGASTRAIASAANAHQPQILYHFDSKEELWRCSVDELFAQLAAATKTDADLPAQSYFPLLFRRYVEFTAATPQLTQLMTHEAGTASERLAWLTERHVQWWYDGTAHAWAELRKAGIAAPIDADLIHYVLIGAASLIFQNSAEAEILLGSSPRSPDVVERLIVGLTATFLPGLAAGP